MTDDIVKRLREHADSLSELYPESAEAADYIEHCHVSHDGQVAEISRLRAELANERKLKNIYFDEWQDANARERALRQALYLSKRALIAAYDDETGWGDELKAALAATAAVLEETNDE